MVPWSGAQCLSLPWLKVFHRERLGTASLSDRALWDSRCLSSAQHMVVRDELYHGEHRCPGPSDNVTDSCSTWAMLSRLLLFGSPATVEETLIPIEVAALG